MFLNVLGNIIFFLVIFILVFLVNYFFICKSKKNKKGKKVDRLTTEGQYLIARFNLDDKKINLTKLNFHISIMNAFIISFVSTFVSLVSNNLLIQLSVGFALLMGLIYAIYELYGRHIKKKWGK